VVHVAGMGEYRFVSRNTGREEEAALEAYE
jgi:hypothetical protein